MASGCIHFRWVPQAWVKLSDTHSSHKKKIPGSQHRWFCWHCHVIVQLMIAKIKFKMTLRRLEWHSNDQVSQPSAHFHKMVITNLWEISLCENLYITKIPLFTNFHKLLISCLIGWSAQLITRNQLLLNACQLGICISTRWVSAAYTPVYTHACVMCRW